MKLSAIIRTAAAEYDRRTVKFFQSQSNLILALVVLSLCIWGIVQNSLWFVLWTVIIGALAYFSGIFVGLVIGALATIGDIFLSMRHGFHLSVLVVEVVGYVCVSWLGYLHKRQQEIQKDVLANMAHEDQVVPWVVLNEVRTSLAAMRFLLFPHSLQEEASELQVITDELSRIENLFSQIERERNEAESDLDVPLRSGKRGN